MIRQNIMFYIFDSSITKCRDLCIDINGLVRFRPNGYYFTVATNGVIFL